MAAATSLSISFSSPHSHHLKLNHVLFALSLPTRLLRVSAFSTPPKARFVARRTESVPVPQLRRPLSEYMCLPASQYSVLDAERIERVDDKTRLGAMCIGLSSLPLRSVLFFLLRSRSSPMAVALSSCPASLTGHRLWLRRMTSLMEVFDIVWYGNAAYMVNQISCGSNESSSSLQELSSDTVIEVSIEIPFAFRANPVQAIESSGTQVLEQILKIMLPRFLAQLVKDYQAWASGDRSRQPLGTGEI